MTTRQRSCWRWSLSCWHSVLNTTRTTARTTWWTAIFCVVFSFSSDPDTPSSVSVRSLHHFDYLASTHCVHVCSVIIIRAYTMVCWAGKHMVWQSTHSSSQMCLFIWSSSELSLHLMLWFYVWKCHNAVFLLLCHRCYMKCSKAVRSLHLILFCWHI